MYIVPIAWLYVALMMAVAEASHPSGTLLGAVITFVLYGVGPVALVLYLMSTPARRRALKAREAAALSKSGGLSPGDPSAEPDAGCHASADPIAPVRKEP